MKKISKYIPYKVCENIITQNILNYVLYIDLSQQLYVPVTQEMHEWLISDNKNEALYEGYKPILNKLVECKIIEPDMSKVSIGKYSIHVPHKKKVIKEEIGLKDLYVEDISTIDALKKHGYIQNSSVVNLLFDPKEQLLENCTISGYIITSSFHALSFIKNVTCKGIRIECSQMPSEEDIALLIKTSANYPIHIALQYTLHEDIAEYLSKNILKTNYNNISISYDVCSMHASSPRNGKFTPVKDIPSTAFSQLKLSCGAGKFRFFIDKNGNIYSCYRVRSADPIGNIYSDQPEKFISSRRMLPPGIIQKCQSCALKYFCSGGCKAEYDKNGYVYCREIEKTLLDVFQETYKKQTININAIEKHNDLSHYEYMCERNALRVLLLGYNIEEPLFWMRCGLFLQDEDFSLTGCFSTSFFRQMLDPEIIPILGETKNSLDWKRIDNHLANNNPVLLTVDVYYMPYKHNTYFHNSHGSHKIILLQKTSNGYIVLDWYHPDYFCGEVSKEDLNLARLSDNEKNQISVFSGFPIQASYQLLHMDNLPKQMDLLLYVRNNLYLSMKSLLKPTGPLYFFKKAYEDFPEWLCIPGHKSYENAIESFFLFDLELKLLMLYFDRMKNFSLYEVFQPELLFNIIQQVKTNEEMLKNKLIYAYRKHVALDTNLWTSLLKEMHTQLVIYCETVLKLLKKS